MYEYRAELLKVVDGDTCDMRIDVGFAMTTVQRCRLLRINAPEMKGDTREAGERSKSYLESLLKQGPLVIRTEKDDAFGRYLAEILVEQSDGIAVNVNQAMLDSGHSVEYSRR